MKVSNRSSLTSEPTPSVDIYDEAPATEDIHWFNAQLNASGTGTTPATTDESILSGIAESISGNQRAQKDAFRDLKMASRSSSVEDFARANEQLSNYYIESLMNAKVIGKAVQSVDKLNNLQ